MADTTPAADGGDGFELVGRPLTYLLRQALIDPAAFATSPQTPGRLFIERVVTALLTGELPLPEKGGGLLASQWIMLTRIVFGQVDGQVAPQPSPPPDAGLLGTLRAVLNSMEAGGELGVDPGNVHAHRPLVSDEEPNLDRDTEPADDDEEWGDAYGALDG